MNATAPASPSSPPRNRLLARLPLRDYQQLLPKLGTVRLRPKRVLLRSDTATQKVYFLEGGVCSLAAATADGQTASVALVGSEGAIGLRPFGGEGGITAEVEIVDGEAMVMNLAAFRGELARCAAFADLIERYTTAFGAGLMQSVACNALHPVERRFARLLLDIHDRIGRDAFPLTHYALAAMLGVRRATVTLCARSLRRNGLVECHHKHVVIHDPKRLEEAACECYHIVKGHFARVLP